jgi:ABC-type sugar transport system substrate-binding protein
MIRHALAPYPLTAAAVILCAAATLSLSGCGKKEDTTTTPRTRKVPMVTRAEGSNAEGSNAEGSNAEGSQRQEGRGLRIAVVLRDTERSSTAMRAGADAAARETGAEIIWPGAVSDDPQWQMQALQNAINRGVDGIVVSPADDSANTAMETAIGRGIEVVIVDSDAAVKGISSRIVAASHRPAGDAAAVRFGNDPASVAALRNDEIQALVLPPSFELGHTGVLTAIAAVRGRDVRPQIAIAVVIATKDNMTDPSVTRLINPHHSPRLPE